MEIIHESLKNTLQSMSEEEFTQSVVIPLISELHPGKIEYTHSSIEAGRDIISYGIDSLGRESILCIQVKSNKISYSPSKFGELKYQAITAKESGVILENGAKLFPNEVWVVSAKPFNEPTRRQVVDSLLELEKKNIKIIALDELAKLLIKKLPSISSKFSKIINKEASLLISELSTHMESRAFGFPVDKEIEDFFVPVTIAPNTNYAKYAIENAVHVEDKEYDNSEYLSDLLKTKRIMNLSELKFNINKKNQEKYGRICFRVKYYIDVKIQIVYEGQTDSILKRWIRITKKLAEIKEKYPEDKRIIEIEDQLDKIKIYFTIKYHYRNTLDYLIENIKSLINLCPNVLTDCIDKLIVIHNELNTLDGYVEYIFSLFEQDFNDNAILHEELVRINVPDPLNILKLSNLVLIEGPPGCGKTTLLRIIAIRLLDNGSKVLYVNCSNIKSSFKDRSLLAIVKEFCKGNLNAKWLSHESILFLDGLDECSFDLSGKINKSQKEFLQIIVSSRKAYKVNLRNTAFNIALATFGNQERTLFFEKWFFNQRQYLENINSLIKTYQDIDYHTRLPLIATITASLIQNGYEPKTRFEIYDFRLQLMLSNWDRCREVNRIRVNDPKAKRRFLRRLAYNVHSAPNRRRTFQQKDMREAYEESLGYWGYNHKYEDIFHDLIYSSGIIIEENSNKYSFGHLTFQEHLAGEFIYEQNHTLNSIENKMTKDWWREPLLFYASLKGDITDLISDIAKSEELFSFADLIVAMLNHAPYTSPGAKEILFELIKFPEDLT